MNWKTTLLFIPALLIFGCGKSGPETYPVTGVVSYQGKPLPYGAVFFVPEKGSPCKPVAIDENGRYRLEAAAGRYSVAVVALPTVLVEDIEKKSGMRDEFAHMSEVELLIPDKYGRHDTSDITVVVKTKKPNTIDIDLD